MTREEALKKVKGYLTNYAFTKDYDEVEEIMTALEQNPYGDILDQLKAEIKKCAFLMSYSQRQISLPLFVILKIIDKYKTKIEENKM